MYIYVFIYICVCVLCVCVCVRVCGSVYAVFVSVCTCSPVSSLHTIQQPKTLSTRHNGKNRRS